MLINYTGKNIQITDDMRTVTEKNLSKLDKFFDDEVRCNVTFSEFKEDYVVEITINLPGSFVRAEEAAPDYKVALDSATDLLTRQVRKHKTKLQKKYRGKETIRLDNIPDWTGSDFDREERVVKTKSYSNRPMSEEEAIMQIELVGHNFYAFNNSSSNEINILYKRKNGGYGLLVPEA